MQKAYDTVWRQTLLNKLENKYNIDQHTVDMIRSMYTETHSIVRVGNRYSTTIKTGRGLHQGAVSSPILFNYYINDLIKQLNDCPTTIKINKYKIN